MKPKNCVGLAIFLSVVFIGVNSGCGGSQAATQPPPGVTVTVSPTSATVAANGTLRFTAIVANDSTNMGVNWTVTCVTAPCGTVSPTSTKSDVLTTYTAPPNSPAPKMAT